MKKYTKFELGFERVYSIFRDCIIYAFTLAIILCAVFILRGGKVFAMELKTTLTSRPDIAERLQEQKGYNIREISEFISKFEDFSATPFPDPSGTGYVIGYGFQPRGRNYMSKEQANLILDSEVRRLIPQITKKYGFIPQNKMMSLVSILYNTPTYSKVIHNNDIIEAFKSENIAFLRKEFNHSLRGINIRRNIELNNYFNII